MILRDYQTECGQAITDATAAGCWSQVIVLPTGAGKTVIFAQIPSFLSAMLAAYPWRLRRMLVIAHRDELLEQAARKIHDANPDLSVEIEQGDRYATPMADVVVASIQTLVARDCKRLIHLDDRRRADDVGRIRIVICDEAHHAAAESYQKVFDVLGLMPPAAMLPKRRDADPSAARAAVAAWRVDYQPGRVLIGVTATPNRADAIGLEWTFQQVVYEKSLRWMIEHGYLAPPVGYLVETDLNLDVVKVVAGDFQTAGLAAVVNTPTRNDQLFAAWTAKAAGLKTIAFTVDVQHAKDLAAVWRANGVPAEAVYGDMDRDRKRAILDAFTAGSIRMLANCQLLTEGYDEPSIQCAILARPTKSPSFYMQQVGRALRLFPGKTEAVILDGVDNSTKHSLVTLGDLFGLPGRFNLAGGDAMAAADAIERIREDYPTLDLTGSSTLADIHRRIKAIDLWNVRPAAAVTAYATMNWLERSADHYVMDIPGFLNRAAAEADRTGNEQLHIEAGMLGSWRVFVRGVNRPDFPIAMADTVRDAFTKAERWVQMNRPHVVAMKAKDAAWRSKAPTSKQIEALQRMKAPFMPKTRGEASDMFDRFIHRRR